MLKVSELRTKNINQLNKMLIEQKKKLEDYVGDVYRGKEKDVSQGRFLKKDVARIKTVLAEKKFLEKEKNAEKTN